MGAKQHDGHDADIPDTLSLQLRRWADTHNWHEPGILTNRLKLRRAFAKPVRKAVNEFMASGRDALALLIKTEFAKLLETARSLDRMCGRRCDEEDEVVKLEHTKAWLVEMLCDLAAMLENGETDSRDQNPENSSQNEEWITLKEAERLTGKCRGTLSRLAGRGKIMHNGIKGRGRRLSKASVLLYQKKQEQKQTRADYEEYQREIRAIPDRH